MLCHYVEFRYAECVYVECHFAECLYADCHYSECRFVWRPYDECSLLNGVILSVVVPSLRFVECHLLSVIC
jgi:hypothetical protein